MNRGDPPIISTYAAGGDRRRTNAARRSGDRQSRPLLGTVGTASAVAIVAIGGTLTYLTPKPARPGVTIEANRTPEPQGSSPRSRIELSYADDKASAAPFVVLDSHAAPLRAKTIVTEVVGNAATSSHRSFSRREEANVPVLRQPGPVVEASEADFAQPYPMDQAALANQDIEIGGGGPSEVPEASVPNNSGLVGVAEASGLRADGGESELRVSPGELRHAPVLASASSSALLVEASPLRPAVDRPMLPDDRTGVEPFRSVDAGGAPLTVVDLANSAPPLSGIIEPTVEPGGTPVSDASRAPVQERLARHIDNLEERYNEAPPLLERPALSASQVLGGPEFVQDPSPEVTAFSTGGYDVGASTALIQDDQLVAIKLGDLISLFENQLGRSLFVWLSSSESAAKFVTPATLQAAGIDASFDSQSRRIVLSVPEE